MIPVQNTMTEIDHLPGEEVDFTIGDARWVMRSMADLYSNRELAVIREYSTNARDAMIEAGNADEPIEVTLPDTMNPYFSVRDFGIGMSEAELKEVYTKFGASTKRESDEFNGMLGFGSKSAVAYTNSFTVTAVKDGVKTVAVITRKPDFSITLKVVMTVATDERNGVTVQVPVHNHQEFSHKANDFYRFWLPGTVLVNGKQPEWAVGDRIGENLYYYPQAGTSYVVMGNVAYRIANPDALFPRGMNRISFVAYVDNGAVEFTPSREDLKYSDHTKNALHAVINDFIDTAVTTAKKEIAAATTHAEAYKKWDEWRRRIGVGQVDDLTFKGDKLVERFDINAMFWNRSLDRYSTGRRDSWEISKMEHTFIVTSAPVSIASSHKARVREYLSKANAFNATYILFTVDASVSSPWVDPARVMDWDAIKAATPPPKRVKVTSTAPGRLAGTFDRIDKVGREYEKDVPDKPLYYVDVQALNRSRNDLSNVLRHAGMDAKVVVVPANRKDKFLRNYPHAIEIYSYLRGTVKLDGESLVTPPAVEILKTKRTDVHALSVMDPEKVDDPELKRVIRLHREGLEEHLKEYEYHRVLANWLGMGMQFKQHGFNQWEAKETPLTSKYPLATMFRNGGGTEYVEHLYFYINKVYQDRKDGKNV